MRQGMQPMPNERETGGRPRWERESAPDMFGKIAAVVVKKLRYSRPPKRLSSERTAHHVRTQPQHETHRAVQVYRVT